MTQHWYRLSSLALGSSAAVVAALLTFSPAWAQVGDPKAARTPSPAGHTGSAPESNRDETDSARDSETRDAGQPGRGTNEVDGTSTSGRSSSSARSGRSTSGSASRDASTVRDRSASRDRARTDQNDDRDDAHYGTSSRERDRMRSNYRTSRDTARDDRDDDSRDERSSTSRSGRAPEDDQYSSQRRDSRSFSRDAGEDRSTSRTRDRYIGRDEYSDDDRDNDRYVGREEYGNDSRRRDRDYYEGREDRYSTRDRDDDRDDFRNREDRYSTRDREDLREDIRDTTRDFRDTARDVRDRARDTVRDVRNNIRSSRSDSRDFDVSSVRAADVGLWFNRSTNDGLVISDVASSGAISQFGFREGDRIVSVNGTRVASEREFVETLFADDIRDQRVQVVVYRNGQQQTITVQPSVLVEGYTTVQHDPLEQFGVVLDDRYYDRLVVWKVLPRTPAYYSGIRAGDTIWTWGDQRLTSSDQLVRSLQSADGSAQVTVYRNRQPRQLDVELQQTALRDDRRTSYRPDLESGAADVERFSERREERIENRLENRGFPEIRTGPVVTPALPLDGQPGVIDRPGILPRPGLLPRNR